MMPIWKNRQYSRVAFPRSQTQNEPPRAAAAHGAIAGLAAIGALFIQISWRADFDPITKHAWQPHAALAIVFATGWLLWTAWVHAAIVRSRGAASVARSRLLGR